MGGDQKGLWGHHELTYQCKSGQGANSADWAGETHPKTALCDSNQELFCPVTRAQEAIGKSTKLPLEARFLLPQTNDFCPFPYYTISAGSGRSLPASYTHLIFSKHWGIWDLTAPQYMITVRGCRWLLLWKHRDSTSQHAQTLFMGRIPTTWTPFFLLLKTQKPFQSVKKKHLSFSFSFQDGILLRTRARGYKRAALINLHVLSVLGCHE